MSCIHYEFILKKQDRYYIHSTSHNNCVLCLINERGAMTQDEVAKYFGVTKMRISQLEKRALQNLKKKTLRYEK